MVGKATKLRLAKRPMTLGFAAVAQLVERVLGKDEVMGSNPISSSAVMGFYNLQKRMSGFENLTIQSVAVRSRNRIILKFFYNEQVKKTCSPINEERPRKRAWLRILLSEQNPT